MVRLSAITTSDCRHYRLPPRSRQARPAAHAHSAAVRSILDGRPLMASSGNGEKGKGRRLDVAALESWLWEAACQVRGPLDAPKFKDYILPLVFLKRLSDVFDDEVAHL